MRPLEPFLTTAVINAICAHMFEDRPNEACGYIVKKETYEYVRTTNTHKEPERAISYTKAINAKIQRDDNVIAYVHTHPVGPAHPSKRDLEVQKLVKKPSVIASLDPQTGVADVFSFGDHLLDLPLHDRVFRFGVTDCYEAIRSWRYQNTGHKMDAYARCNAFWSLENADVLEPEDKNMYMRHYEAQGYTAFEPNFSDPDSEYHPAIGDLLLMKLGTTLDNVPNHAGIYVGGNLVYHHREGKLSGDTPLGYLPQGTVRMWARSEDKL